jgi:LysR family transcriptional regulator, glycine cleavage system transcriptional activator
MRRQPSLDTLRLVEVVGRRRSFTLAAAELNVTPGAVSQRIKALEDDLGVKLFDRGHEMALTDKGRVLVGKLEIAFREIALGVELVSPMEAPSILTISLLPAFASRWLLPRLAAFSSQFPDIQIKINADPYLVGFESDEVDIAIRFGGGIWPGLQAIKLFDERLFPVASPLFNDGKLPQNYEDLLNLPLLQDERLPWSMWFRVARLPTNHPVKGTSFSDADLLLQAAAAGRGVALARSSLVAEDIESGRLIRLFDLEAVPDYSYFLVYPRHSERLPKVKAFRNWLLDEAKRFKSRVADDNSS